LFYLVHESIEIRQRHVVGAVAASRAELVVVVVLDACGGKVAVACLEVFVRRAGPAVQQQNLQVRVVADGRDAAQRPTLHARAGPARCRCRVSFRCGRCTAGLLLGLLRELFAITVEVVDAGAGGFPLGS
jgi:hypothetical protein